jgi:hypothetical protein
MNHWYWSAPLAGFGLVGLYLAGRRSYWGWVVGLLDEVLWIVYAVNTRQWPFCLSALAYGWVYGRNLRSWLRDPPPAPRPPAPRPPPRVAMPPTLVIAQVAADWRHERTR